MFNRSKPHKDRDKEERERDRDRPRKSPRLPTDEKKRRKKSRLSEDITNDIADEEGRPSNRPRRRRQHSSSVAAAAVETQDRHMMDDPRASRSSLPYPSFSKAHSRESVLPSSQRPKSVPVDILTPDATEVGIVPETPPSPPLTSPPSTSAREAASASPLSNTRSSSTVKTHNTAKVRPSPSNFPSPSVRIAAEDETSALGSMKPESSVDSDATSVAPSRPHTTRLELFPAEPDTEGLGASPITPTQSSFNMPSISDVFVMSPQPPPPPPPPFVPNSVPRVDYLLHNGGIQQTIPRTLLGAGNSSSSSSFSSSQQNAPPSAVIEGIFAPYHKLLDQYSVVLEKNGSLAVATGYKSVARRLLGRLENVFARDISSHSCRCVMCQSSEEMESERVGWGEILEWVGGRRETPPWPPFDFENLGGNDKAEEQPQASLRSPSRVSIRTKTPMQLLNIDDDIPEEYRDHYIRQSAKTKRTVDKWLMAQPEDASAPPPEVDNETLTFTILTHLNPDDRPIFTALLANPPSSSGLAYPESRSQTPAQPVRSDVLMKAGSALQRLYRLPTLPRDPETAIFLLRYHRLHNVLATLSAINNSEWDILTSGRFDGFLWSGAEDVDPDAQISRGPSRAQSRGPQAFPYRTISRNSNAPVSRVAGTTFQNMAEIALSRGPTPFQASPGGKPVPLDEEQEIAVLAEIEREIYVGMEALEDAFEALHRKAEIVRQRIRERGAGLSSSGAVTTQSGGNSGSIEVVAGTPGPAGVSWSYPSASEVDDESEAGDVPPWSSVSELAPDDSASNISSARHRRPKRRSERRTPAPLEEESEDDVGLG